MKKNTIIAIFALIPVILILTSTFSGDIYNMIKRENVLLIPMQEVSQEQDIINYYKIQEYIAQNIYVPNYDSKITFYSEDEISLSKDIMFKIVIEDVGILPLDKPYFYIYLLDSNKKIRACFPECNNFSDDLFGWNKTKFYLNDNYFLKYDSNNIENATCSEEILNLLSYDIKDYEFAFLPSELESGKGKVLYSKNTEFLMSKKEYSFYYTFPIDKIGSWSIYVLTFDESYMDRNGILLNFESYESSSKRAINYEKHEILVKEREKDNIFTFFKNNIDTTLKIIKIIAAIIGSILTFRTVFYLISKYYKKIISFIDSEDTHKRIYLLIILVLIFLIIMQYLIMR